MRKYMVVLSYYKFIDDLRLDYKYFDTIEECVASVTKFIKKYNLTETQWNGGNVYSDGKVIGKVTFNNVFELLTN